jgi:hypothetical protein
MDLPKKFHFGNLGLPVPPRRKSLVRSNNGGRNIGLKVAPVVVKSVNGNKQQSVNKYIGLSNESGQVGVSKVQYAYSGKVSNMPSSEVKRYSSTRSHVNVPQQATPLVTAHQKTVTLKGAKRSRTVRRGRKRKSLRRK